MIEKFDISGMTCAACSAHIHKAVSNVDGVKTVNVNLLKNSMEVEYEENLCSVCEIENAVKKAGYGASVKKVGNNEKNKKLNKISGSGTNLIRLIFSFVFLIFIMYFSMGNMMWGFYGFEIFDHKKNPVGFALIQFLFLLPIIYLNFNYFKSGFKKLFKGNPNMDSLIAMSSMFSILYGIVVLFILSFAQAKISLAHFDFAIDIAYYQDLISTYHSCIYFESAGMILCFVSLGKYFENLSKKKTTLAIEKLVDLSPKTATIINNGIQTIVSASKIVVGDIIVIKQGEIIPVDGQVISGSCSVNESNITGESMPISKNIGDKVYCSTILDNGYIHVRAEKVGEETSFARVIKLVEEASNSKAPISKLADKISGVFVPVIFGIALLTFVINLCVTQSFELSFNFGITVLVIACPCALGLATPVAIMVGTGKGAENGLLIKNAEIMEKAHLIKTIVFDKTGTITNGSMTVTDFEIINKDYQDKKQEILSIIFSIEKCTNHPLAKAMVEYTKNNGANSVVIQNFEVLEGLGVKAKIDDEIVYIGNINLAKELNVNYDEIESKFSFLTENAKIPLVFIENNSIIAIIALKDNIKENAIEAISILKQQKIKVVMLTGDNKKTAEIVAKQVGVDQVFAEVKPDEKLKIINSLKQDSKNLVAMVGDGVNDAPALLSSDLGIGIGAGSEVAIETSDIVLIKNDLMGVVNAISLSKRIIKTIKLGLFWAFFYNLLCVLIATGIFYYPFGLKINPMIAAIAMTFSSVSVVLNALTINLFKPFSINSSKQQLKNNLEISYKNEIKNKGVKKMEFYVKGMMCQNCQKHVKTALENSGEEVVEVNLDSKKVVINTSKTQAEIFEIIKNAGYEATVE